MLFPGGHAMTTLDDGQTRTRLRSIPAVADVLEAYAARGGVIAPAVAADIVRHELDGARAAMLAGDPTPDDLLAHTLDTLEALMRPRLRPGLNGSGVLIHTNLGRSQVSDATARAMAEVAAGAVSLEVDPETNRRGGRMDEATVLMRALTGAEATLVVNNNAAAILLVLSALAGGREVVVSRGEAVEIGGGYRIPDVLRQSGATMVEVGTTNRTYPRDYADAIGPGTALLLKVHPSNFRITGFTRSATLADLAPVATGNDVLLIEDQGSGALIDPATFGLAHEPTVGASLAGGAHLVTVSGDKLLGGPQAGIICGRADLVALVERHPLARAFRASKSTLAGVTATLRHYLLGEAETTVPVWRMIAADPASIEARAGAVVEALEDKGVGAEAIACESTVGGGSLPGETLPSTAVSPTGTAVGSVDEVARKLRLADQPLFTRIEDGRLLVDLRTILPEHDGRLVAALVAGFATG
jgi:L-seryl-tRNA(Ser) seleniumtransferase